jgi:YD repeat-containing protein
MRPTAVRGVAAHGIHMSGPPMLRPSEIDGILSAARAQAKRRTIQRAQPLVQAVPHLALPGRTHGAPPAGNGAIRQIRSVQSSVGTGINPWWRYQEQTLPGGGRVMVNVGTGDLLVQDDDMVVAHKGLAMAFRRTYNSQSLHDVNASDAGGLLWEPPGLYGNGWTNTFDAHLTRTIDGSLFYVNDIDGTRYDFTIVSNGVYAPVAGNDTTITFDGNCGFLWTKKSGTSYYFYRPNPNAVCSNMPTAANGAIAGYAGRLYQIIGRNRNTFIIFNYSWDNGDASATGKIAQLAAATESGMTATLSFADVSGHRLLQQVTFPDGATSVTYGYDGAGNLAAVSHPPNNSAGIRPLQLYGYTPLGAGSVLLYESSPRWCAGTCGTDGAWTRFGFAGADQVTSAVNYIGHAALVNPSIADGSNASLLQPSAPSGVTTYLSEYYATGVATPTLRDSDGHAINWVVDAQGRPTQTQACTATVNQACTGSYLISNESWDAANNLTSQVDARGNETDYQYDAMGNATAVGEPSTSTSQGTFKPTKLFDYDAYNNVVAYCDEAQTHAAHADWVPGSGSQSDSLCASQAGAIPHWQATYVYPSYEPYGELTSMTTPLGYTRTFSYAPAQQGGADYGLPTAVTGGAIAQLDGSSVTPSQTFWYDGSGNLRCYSKGVGSYVLSYDALGRLVSEADPDDSSANGTSVCAKSTGQPGWNTQTTTTYFPDGSKASTQTPSERAFGVSTTYTYDPDGNVITETQHHGCVPAQACPAGTTRKWYDGAGRLVEVAQPHDTRTLSNPVGNYDGDPWLTRYWYDLSGGGTVSLAGSVPFRAYGNLFKTQTLLADGGWSDVRGSAFDAADRETAKYSYSVSQGIGVGPMAHQLETTTQQYDLDATSLGLLAQKINPSGESVSYTYDSLGHVANESYAGDAGRTAAETYVYDPDGRKYSVTSSQFGMQQYGYDADGRLTTLIEPNGGGVTSPAQISYAYYANGQRSAISIASSALTQTNALTYSYRADGALRTQAVNALASGTWSNQYTDGGRLSAVSGVDTQARSYDASGQLQNYTVSAGTATYTHDPEGSVLTQYLPNVMLPGAGSPVSQTFTNTLNVRGELVDAVVANTSSAHRRMTTNSGCTATSTIPDDLSQYDPTADSTASPATCDRINGISIAADSSVQSVLYGGQEYLSGTQNAEAFDATGRIVQATHTAYGNAQLSGSQAHVPAHGSGDPGAADAGAGTAGGPTDMISSSKKTAVTRAYDTENHLRTVQSTISSKSGTNPKLNYTITGPATTIGWGPNGHPVLVTTTSGSTTTNETLHWDGDTILFVTNANGALTDFKVGLDGDITPRDIAFTGLSVYDRDPAGVIAETSNATGSTGFNPLDPNTITGAGAAGTMGYQAALVPDQYVRGDGFMVAGVQINGVRAFDPNIGAWTTPDAYEGNVHDPVSQQRYMWNRGNAFDYSDPSGYCAEGVGACMGGVDWGALDRLATGMLSILSVIIPGGPEARLASGGRLLAAAEGASAATRLRSAEAVGSALKEDTFHRAASWFRKDAAQNGTHFEIKGGDGKIRTLTQVKATVNGKKGVAEFVVDDQGRLTHQLFKEGRKIDGKPN